MSLSFATRCDPWLAFPAQPIAASASVTSSCVCVGRVGQNGSGFADTGSTLIGMPGER